MADELGKASTGYLSLLHSWLQVQEPCRWWWNTSPSTCPPNDKEGHRSREADGRQVGVQIQVHIQVRVHVYILNTEEVPTKDKLQVQIKRINKMPG